MPQRRRRSFKEDLKDVFSMHRGERRGMAVLIGLCVVAAAWVTWEQWIRPHTVKDPDTLKIVWAQLQDSTARSPDEARSKNNHLELFAFNPNHLPTEQWVQLGLSERQAASIHKYEAKGGQFRTKHDVARMHVVDPDLYAQWAPYIQLPDSLPRRKWKDRYASHPYHKDTTRWRSSRKKDAPSERSLKVELNAADSAALVAIRGIGPSFARAILRYRERLGGFVSLDQLNEIYILRDKPDAVERIRAHLLLDTSLVRKIPLNSCTVEQLGPHPYIGWKIAKALVAYRRQHGPFPNVAATKGCVLMTDSILNRIAPYLTLE